MAFEITQEEIVAFCKEAARAFDRIADGKTETICIELPWVDEEGQRLLFMATIDPELWPQVREGVKRHLANKRERQRLARAFTTATQENKTDESNTATATEPA